MDEILPFLRAIAANPDDDTPRLVFSDWLEEHDHHERAEFIRLQIELARMDASDEGYADKTARMRRCGVFTRQGKVPFFDHLPTSECRIGFHRGFIASINTWTAKTIDNSGFDLLPIQALRTDGDLIDNFKRFAKLKWLEYSERDNSPARMLEILGPNGWFKELEELSLRGINTACLAAGVIPQFDLPRLRNFIISTDDFTHLGSWEDSGDESNDDEDDRRRRTWGGLPEYLPRNAIPNAKSPLERFIWHASDDSDSYSYDDGWDWRGPTMRELLSHLKVHNLKQVEVAVDYDDHENGMEGVIAASFGQNPLTLAPTLERVTLDDSELRLLESLSQRLKALRVYGSDDFVEALFELLDRLVCLELESLHVEARGGWWESEPMGGPEIIFLKLKSLWLSGLPFEMFSNCDFPNLISLLVDDELKTILPREWPTLQRLNVSVRSDSLSDLKAFAKSDCCPNLTTLTIEGYFDLNKVDFSFLAKCPHMPFLSLIRIPHYSTNRDFIVDEGRLLPVRGDVVLDPQTPSMPYRIHAAFEST